MQRPLNTESQERCPDSCRRGRAGFCISRSSLCASQHALLYLGKWVTIDLQHPGTSVQKLQCLPMLSATAHHAYKKCGSDYRRAISFQDHLIVFCPSIPPLVLVLRIWCIFGVGYVLVEACLQSAVHFRALKRWLQQLFFVTLTWDSLLLSLVQSDELREWVEGILQKTDRFAAPGSCKPQHEVSTPFGSLYVEAVSIPVKERPWQWP